MRVVIYMVSLMRNRKVSQVEHVLKPRHSNFDKIACLRSEDSDKPAQDNLSLSRALYEKPRTQNVLSQTVQILIRMPDAQAGVCLC